MKKLEILKHAKQHLENKKTNVLGLCGVMRHAIHEVTGEYIVDGERVINYIPELIEFKPKNLHPTTVFWFPVGERKERLEIINQLIEIYEQKIYSTI